MEEIGGDNVENLSILTSIKKLLGITEEYTHFDMDLILHINSAFMVLNQLGVGPDIPFTIKDKMSTWDEFIPADNKYFEAVVSYVHQKVKLLFDPPLSSVVAEATNRTISELEWRLTTAAELQNLGKGANQNE